MLDLERETTRLFTEWATLVTGGDYGNPSSTAFVRAVSTLLDHHDDITGSEYGPAYAGDLRRWSRKVKRATGITNRPVRIPTPCPVCDLRGLRWYPSEADLRCLGCGSNGEPLIAQGLQAIIAAIPEEV